VRSASTGQNGAYWQCLYPRWMQPGQAAKSKAMTIGTTPKFVAITTPLSLPIILAVPTAVNSPKESVSLLILPCRITIFLRLTLVDAIMKRLYICWPNDCKICHPNAFTGSIMHSNAATRTIHRVCRGYEFRGRARGGNFPFIRCDGFFKISDRADE
jgi:hypothetical protein